MTNIQAILSKISDIERRLHNIVRVGEIHEADYAAARVRVKMGDIVTNWIPWMTQRAGNDRTWHAPEVGEQVVVVSPSGDLAIGFAIPSIFQNDFPGPENVPTKATTIYDDGATFQYDREAHKWTINIPSGEVSIDLTTGGDVNAEIDGDVNFHVTGDVTGQVEGNVDLTVDGDVTAQVEGEMTATVQGDATVETMSNGLFKAGMLAKMEAGTVLNLKAPLILLDCVNLSFGSVEFPGVSNTSEARFKVQHLIIEANQTDIISPVTQTGGDMTSDGISAQHHLHDGVQPGSGLTDEPV